MKFKLSSAEALDRTLAVLERELLTMPDEEVIASCRSSEVATDVRSLISRHLAGRVEGKIPARRVSDSGRTRRRDIGEHSVELRKRFELLRQLVATHSEISPQLRAVFSSEHTPSSRELDFLTEELRLIGVLPKGDSGKS